MIKGIKSVKLNSLAKRILYTLGLLGISILLILSVKRKAEGKVKEHLVHIKPIKGERNLIEEEEVNYIYSKYLGFGVLDADIKDLDTKELEERLKADKRIKKVEVFIDAHNNLNTWIIQRQPVVRVVDSKEFSYYIDEEGNDIPTKRGLAIRVPVATGYIDLYRIELINSEKNTALQNVFKCAQFIMQDEFLNKFIEQIHVNSERDIELIPKVGKQYIILGDAQNLEKKFQDIKTIYKDGLPTVGWTKYKGINVKYDGVIYGIM
jgi:cell division protein FtsQ